MGTVPRDHKSFSWEFDQVLQRLDDFARGVTRETMIPEEAARHHRDTARQAAALMREMRDVGASRGLMCIVEEARGQSAELIRIDLERIAESIRLNRDPLGISRNGLVDLLDRAARALAKGMP